MRADQESGSNQDKKIRSFPCHHDMQDDYNQDNWNLLATLPPIGVMM